MSEEKVERKVAVILATDVVGYSTKIEQNETQTLQTLKACREIISSHSMRRGLRPINVARRFCKWPCRLLQR